MPKRGSQRAPRPSQATLSRQPAGESKGNIANVRRSWWWGLIVVATPLLVFGRVLSHDFVLWDDNLHVTENRHLWPVSAAGLARLWSGPYFGEYVPLTYTWFAAEAALSKLCGDQLSPAIFHAGSLLLHAICCWVVFRLLARFASPPAACAGALVFALHPLQAESVAWVSETRGLLSACCTLAALGGYVDWARRAAELTRNAPSTTGSAREERFAGWLDRRYVLASLALVGALLAKPSGVATPLVAVALDRFWLARPWRRVLVAVAPWVVLSAGLVVLTKLQQPSDEIRSLAPAYLRPWIAADALGFYLSKFAWPWPLLADYGRTPTAVLASRSPLGLVALGAAAFVAWRGPRALRVAGAMSVAALLPVLGLAPFSYQDISTVADRYAYLALLGPAWAVAAVVDALRTRAAAGATKPTTLRGAITIGLAWLIAWGALAYGQTAVWRNTETLFAHVLAYHADSFVAHNNLSVARRAAGDWVAAETFARRAIELRDYDASAQTNLGAALLDQGRAAEAADAFRRAVELAPRTLSNRRNLALALLRAGQHDVARDEYQLLLKQAPGDPDAMLGLARCALAAHRLDEARAAFEQVVQRDGDSLEALTGLAAMALERGDLDQARELLERVPAQRSESAEVLAVEAQLALRAGNRDEAFGRFGRAAELRPGVAAAWLQWIEAARQGEEPPAALAAARRWTELAPRVAQAWATRGQCHEALGDDAAAAESYRRALVLAPGDLTLTNNLAWLLATSPAPLAGVDHREAIGLAEQVVARAKTAASLDTLAAACAAAEEFDRAVTLADEAAALAIQAGFADAVQEIRARRELYARRQAYRRAPP